MSIVNHSHFITASPSRVWRVLADFAGIHRWHPNVETADQLSKNDRGDDASRRCNFHDGTSVVERVTHWNEGESYSVELSEADAMPLAKAHATMSVVPDASGALVTIEMNYTVKYGPVGWLLGVTIMPFMMKRVFKKALLGLEYHLLTGAEIGSAVPELPADNQRVTA